MAFISSTEGGAPKLHLPGGRRRGLRVALPVSNWTDGETAAGLSCTNPTGSDSGLGRALQSKRGRSKLTGNSPELDVDWMEARLTSVSIGTGG